MLQDIADAIKIREEKVQFAGRTLVVREAAAADELGGDENTPVRDLFYHLMIACVFDEQGKPALEAADLPALKAASRSKMAPLVLAVQRVNGLDVVAEAEKPGAAQA